MSMSPSLLSAMGLESSSPSPEASAGASAVEAASEAAELSAGLSAAEPLDEEVLELLHAVRLRAIAAASIIERNFFILCYLI